MAAYPRIVFRSVHHSDAHDWLWTRPLHLLLGVPENVQHLGNHGNHHIRSNDHRIWSRE